jgi:hypothetical protein
MNQAYKALLASALLMQGLENRYTANYKGRVTGAPIPTKLPNQRQRRKLAAQTR